MKGKRNGRKRIGASRIKRTDWRALLSRGEFMTYNLLTTGVYLFALGAVIYVGLTSANLLVMAMASVVLFVMVAAIAPLDKVGDASGWLFSSQSAEDLQSMTRSLAFWRRGRGQLTPLSGLVLAVLLVTATAGGIVFASATVAGQESSPGDQCQVDVTHDAFRTDNATIQTLNESQSATSTVDNTRVTIEESTGFYRVQAENPNGYCVDLRVEIHEDIIPPAELGTLTSDGNVDATWSDIHDFENQTSYTVVELSVPASATVTFAPNKPTVLLPAWRDQHKREAESLLGRALDYRPWTDDSPLEQRVYTFGPAKANGSTLTIPLTNDNGDKIEEWKAVYRPTGDDAWRPVDTDMEQAVAHRYIDNRSKVQFVFNEGADDYSKRLEVEFTANPTWRDNIQYELRSLKRSFTDITDIPFLTLTTNTGGHSW